MKDQEFNYLLKYVLKISANLEKLVNRLLIKYNINQQQFIVLNEINRHEGITPNEIGFELEFEKSNISKIINKLNKLDLINVILNNKDKRSIKVNMTSKGKEVWKDSIKQLNHINKKIIKELSLNELKIARYQVEKISQIISRK